MDIWSWVPRDGVFRSTDRGVHWVEMKVGLTTTNVTNFATDGRGTLFATDGEFTFRLLRDSLRWTRIARRSIPVAVRSFTCAPSGRLFAGTQSFGVWELAPPPTDPEETDDPTVAIHGFTLLPSYPQPAGGSTALPFEIDRSAKVTLVIHDMLGRKVYSASLTCAAAGRYSFFWEGTDTAAGMYICTINDGSRQAHGRLLRM